MVGKMRSSEQEERQKQDAGSVNFEEPVDFETAISLAGYGKFNYLMILATFFAAMISVFDTTTMAYILPVAQCDLELTNVDKGALNAITYAGMISSAFLWGFISDTFGRHKVLVIGYFVDGLFALMSAFAQSFAIMLVLRYLVGFMICGPYAVLITFLAEFHGIQYRSRIIMLTGISIATANYVIPAFAWGLLTHAWELDITSDYIIRPWNAFIIACSLPAFLSGFLMLMFSETPKFLMAHGRCDEALKTFKRIYSVNTGLSGELYPVKYLVDEQSLRKRTPSTNATNKGLLAGIQDGLKDVKPLFLLPERPKAILVFSIQFFGLFSMNTIRLWLPQIFSTMEDYKYSVFGSDNSTIVNNATVCEMLTFSTSTQYVNASFQNLTNEMNDGLFNLKEDCKPGVTNDRMYINSIIVGVASAVGYGCAGQLVNLLGYRTLMISCFFISGVCGIAVFWSVNAELTLALLSMYLAFVSISGTAALGVVVTIFPTTLRTMTVSLTMMFGRIGALVGNLIFPVLLDISCAIPFFLVSLVLIGNSLVSFLLPITKGKALA